MMGRLPDRRRSSALLFGTARYLDPQLGDLPAVTNNLTDLARVLTDPTMGVLDADRCVTLQDDFTIQLVGRHLQELADDTDDLLLVYYAGHGLLIGNTGELHLAVASTEHRNARFSALPFTWIREVLANSAASSRVLILDCCFSGRAIPAMADPRTLVSGQVEVRGSYTLASTSANLPAHAPPGARYTAFTGELLTLLWTGLRGGPQLLCLRDIYVNVARSLRAQGLPEPQQLGTANIDELALARNAARLEVQGQDVRFTLTVTAHDARRGGVKTFEVSRMVACGVCLGTGSTRDRTGLGVICAACDGQGRLRRSSRQQARLPAGVETGARFRIPGRGDAGRHGGPSGDLYVDVVVAPPFTVQPPGFVYGVQTKDGRCHAHGDRQLRISSEALDQVIEHVLAGHPNMTCGMLIGPSEDGPVTGVRPVRNTVRDRPHDRFELDVREQTRVVREVADAGQFVVGYYYGQPPVRGEVFRAQPSLTTIGRSWAGPIYLIVSCVEDRVTDVGAFIAHADGGPMCSIRVDPT